MKTAHVRVALARVLNGSAARSSSWALLGQGSAMVAGTANFLLLARLVGPVEYGLVAATWALVLTTGPVAVLGADRLLVRDVTGAARQDPVRAVGAAFATTIAGSLTAVVVLAALHPVLLPQVPRTLLISLAVADILALGVATCVAVLFFSVDDARSAGLSTTAVSLAKLVAVVAFAVLGTRDVVQWAALYAGLSVLSAALQLVWVVRRFGVPRLTGYHLGRRARDGIPYSGNQAALVVLTDADKALLVRYGFAADAGQYSVAYRLATIVSLPVLAVLQVSLPRFFSHGHDGGLAATAAYARRLLLPLAAYAILAGIGLALAAPLVPVLVGEQYRDSVQLLIALAPLPLLKVLQSLASDALTGAGRQSTRTACVTASAAVNLALNLALLPRYGAPAAVAATLVAETMYAVLAVLAVRLGLRREAGRASAPTSTGREI